MHSSSTLARVCAVVTSLLVVSGCGGNDSNGPEAVEVVGTADDGNGQVGFVSERLPQVVRLKFVSKECEAGGTACNFYAVTGLDVAWGTTSGSVSNASTTTDAYGYASATWTLGTVPGPATLTVGTSGASFFPETVQVNATAILHRPMLAVVFGDAQIAPPSSTLPLDVFVQLTDTTLAGSRAPMPGATVNWLSSTPGASVASATSVTDAQGRASARWTLSATPGPHALVANVPSSGLYATNSVLTAQIAATAQFSAARVLRLVSGGGQTGVAGRAQPQPVVVEYVTLANNVATPISGATISFAAANGGSTSATSVSTNAQGRATITWTLGTTIGAQSLTASTASVAGADPSSVYNVAVSGTAQPVNLVLADNFDVGNQWSVTVTRNDFGAWTSARSVSSSGGNPGGYVRLTQATVTTTNPTFATLFTQQLFTGATYDPSTQGAITSIDYSVDRQTETAIYDAFVIVQGGVEYRAEFPSGSVFSNSVWQTAALTNLQPANFSPTVGPAPALNFTATGGPMQFGFTRGSSQRFAFFSNASGTDNWTVTIKR